MSMFLNTRRDFLKQSMYLGAAAITTGRSDRLFAVISAEQKTRMKFGLVTYLWGKNWDLPTLIANCEKTNFLAVELRTQHAHHVEPSLTQAQRAEVKKRFDDSPVTCLGYGSNQAFHYPDPAVLRKSIKDTFELIKSRELEPIDEPKKRGRKPKEIEPV